MKHVIFFTLLFLLNITFSSGQGNSFICGHAHNDYYNNPPLIQAIEHGFLSVEADVHLKNQKLYVSHDPPEFFSDSILLENLYLKPLAGIIEQNGGFIFPDITSPFFLMVDLKTGSDSTYLALQSALKPYQGILCPGRSLNNCPVKVFVSGNRPVNKILSEKKGFLALDGRPEDLGLNISPEMMPVISENYDKLKSVTGKYNQNFKERLLALVNKAHLEGKMVRLWGAPDDEATWEYLLYYGVDLINTDRVEDFSEFIRNKNAEKSTRE